MERLFDCLSSIGILGTIAETSQKRAETPSTLILVPRLLQERDTVLRPLSMQQVISLSEHSPAALGLSVPQPFTTMLRVDAISDAVAECIARHLHFIEGRSPVAHRLQAPPLPRCNGLWFTVKTHYQPGQPTDLSGIASGMGKSAQGGSIGNH